LVLALAALTGCGQRQAPAQAPVYGYRVVNVYPHDSRAFTQGLLFAGGFLYEGTGLEGQSAIRKVKLETGEVLMERNLADNLFGEGIALLGDTLFQLTWKSGKGFAYDLASFRLLRTFEYTSEGWGLTTDGKRLIMSDGTSVLQFRDPATFALLSRLEVRDGERLVSHLNELEYVEGEIFANVWQTDSIVRIRPSDGKVLAWINLSGLLRPDDRRQPVDVLNGIAYDAGGKRLLVTGKLWPKLFHIEIVPR
jgi:glutamine cyclotransferase